MAGYFRYIIVDLEYDVVVSAPYKSYSQAVAHLRKLEKSDKFKKDSLYIAEIPS